MTRQDRLFARLAIALLFPGLLLGMSASAPAATPATATELSNADSAAGRAMAEHKGIWKWVVPPVKMHGAFDDHDPIGLVAGKLIPADCAFNWTDPDTHQLYCFTSATSLVYFLNSPQTYLPEAQKRWQALKGKLAKAH
ncbi:MAG TPA: hypothetical protein VFN79_09815 [Steroidobacteraceae bacterium]|nr:hypothetical protein [Steroidobacteraceae bacterium]